MVEFPVFKRALVHELETDVADDGLVDISDVVAFISWNFINGAPPAPPYPGCGPDPTDDGIDCSEFVQCP